MCGSIHRRVWNLKRLLTCMICRIRFLFVKKGLTIIYKLNSLLTVSEDVNFLDRLFLIYIGHHFVKRNQIGGKGNPYCGYYI
jgi:hypothetical protein